MGNMNPTDTQSHPETDDVHIRKLKTLLPPAVLMDELPVSDAGAELIASTREAIAAVDPDKPSACTWCGLQALCRVGAQDEALAEDAS